MIFSVGSGLVGFRARRCIERLIGDSCSLSLDDPSIVGNIRTRMSRMLGMHAQHTLTLSSTADQ